MEEGFAGLREREWLALAWLSGVLLDDASKSRIRLELKFELAVSAAADYWFLAPAAAESSVISSSWVAAADTVRSYASPVTASRSR